MPKYKVIQYFVCDVEYEVEAADELEAIQKVWEDEAGDGKYNLDSMSVADTLGMPSEELFRKFGERANGFSDNNGDFVPGIGGVEEIEE